MPSPPDRQTEDRRPHVQETAARIQPLATLPIFVRAAGRTILLAGGSEGAAWKAELLLAAGAQVRSVAADPCEALRELARARPDLQLIERPWTDEDFTGALLALCDAGDEAEGARFRDAGHARGIPVNVVDKPAFCDFQFGSIVNRSPLVIAISTDGAAPVFGQTLRARIEALLPAGFARWAQAAKEWRALLKPYDLPFRARMRFWDAFTRGALADPHATPTPERFDALFAGLQREDTSRGKVVLVGAGPGDPELLTLKAVRALQSADVVMYDDLVSAGVLDLSRREAERVNVGKRGYKPSCGQDEICALLISFAQAGKVVARLKGGDPSIFGRANEEIDALQAAGVAVEVVPGVTAASGAAAALVASLTERDLARRVQFVTAHARDGRLPDDLDWGALADPRATTAVYMGVRTLPALVERLRHAGLPDGTPVFMVERATWPQERVIGATLADIVDRIAEEAIEGPKHFLDWGRTRSRQTPITTGATADADQPTAIPCGIGNPHETLPFCKYDRKISCQMKAERLGEASRRWTPTASEKSHARAGVPFPAKSAVFRKITSSHRRLGGKADICRMDVVPTTPDESDAVDARCWADPA